MKGNFHVRFGEGSGETRRLQSRKVRSTPTLRIGGIPRGQLTEIVGNSTLGMVTLALKILTTIQQGGERVVYLDLAATFNPDYAVLCGLNLETLWIVRPAPYALTWTILYDLVLDGEVGVLRPRYARVSGK